MVRVVGHEMQLQLRMGRFDFYRFLCLIQHVGLLFFVVPIFSISVLHCWCDTLSARLARVLIASVASLSS